MAIGNPLGLAGTVTTGIVSALNRPVTTAGRGRQPAAGPEPVRPGAPGSGPAASDRQRRQRRGHQRDPDVRGDQPGQLRWRARQRLGSADRHQLRRSPASARPSSGQSGSIGIGFAIPANEAKSIASQLISSGKAEHAFLGVSLGDGTASDGTSQRAGAEVTAISANTPAADAGLQKGDVVVAVDGERVDSALSLVANIRERAVGDKVTLTVLRDGKQVDLTATLVAKAAATS